MGQKSLRLMLVFAALVACAVASCARQPSGAAGSASTSKVNSGQISGAEEEPITISTAASTKELVERIAANFTRETGVKVQVNAGSSSSLASQILAGAPVDLFLSANEQWPDKLREAGLAAQSSRLLTNKLVLIVPKGNPAGVKSPQDLLQPAVKRIALANEKVPAGKYADQALTKLGLLEQLVSAGKIARGQDVRTALSYVERGEAEAGIVYATDVPIAKGIEQVHEFDRALHDEIVYVLVLVKRDGSHPAARDLHRYIQSNEANPAYREFGFERLRPAGRPRQP